jgi:hypothetical protein
MMDITITIPPEMQDKLQQRAKDTGRDVAEYVEKLIEKDLSARPSIEEILAPVRKQFEDSGMTEAELDALVEEVRDEIWQEKQAHRSP